MSIRAFLYDADGLDQEVTFDEKFVALLNDRRLLWVDVMGREPQEIARVASLLKFHPASVKAIANSFGRPRLYNYGHYFHFGLMALNPKGNGMYAPAAVEFFCGSGYVVTIHDEEIGFLREFREQDRGETQIGTLSSSMVVASMLDWHLGTYFRALEAFELEVDRVDEEVLTRPVDRERLNELSALRRLISQLRRLIFPQREVFNGLTRPDFALAEGDAAVHFQALNSRFERAIDTIENARNLVLGSFELFTSRAAESTNDFVKALTLITILLGVTGTVAGIFGMNFEVEYWKTGSLGFWGVIAGMVLLIVGTLLYARLKRWI